MRVRLSIPREPLRSALAELLVRAGHLVLPQASDALPELVIATSDCGDCDEALVPTLLLTRRASAFSRPDLAQRLAAAWGTASRVELDSPLDPRALIQALDPTPTALSPVEEAPFLGLAPFLAYAQNPWLVIEAATRLVRWTNPAAEARLARPGGRLTDASIVPQAVFGQTEGTTRGELDGRPATVTWWTVPPGLRCVGWIEQVSEARSAAPENLASLAEIGRATSTFAHELRNPLASLAGALDLLSGDIAPAERSEVAELGRARLAHMQRLLDDTLRFARPIRGAPARVDLALLVPAVVGGARLDPAFRALDMSVGIEPGLPAVLAHEQGLHQALTNLLQNAAEAQPHGGAIRVRVAREGARAVVRVEDDGPGIRPADRALVFTAFWTTKARGTGLGLPFVRRVAEAAGGQACVEEGAHGTCVRLDLPFAS